MFNNLMTPFLLASESPRRKELLKKAGISFEVFPVQISENPNENLNINDRILDIARRKSRAARQYLEDLGRAYDMLLTADTEVVINDQTMGKPASPEDAFHILRRLSGTQHEVKTGLILYSDTLKKEMSHIETTIIHFYELSDQQIWDYVKTGEPMDKAGAYGIQGLGQKFVSHYDGSFENVVGLPTAAVLTLIAEIKK